MATSTFERKIEISNVEDDLMNKSLSEVAVYGYIACNVIATSVDAVGGRYIMIECKDEEKLINFNSDNGFNVISKVPDDNQVMIQMIRKI